MTEIESQLDRAPDFDEDLINHPKHYTSHPSGIEAIDLCEHTSFNVGNAWKYLFRAGKKGSWAEDLKKARWYLDREFARQHNWEEGTYVVFSYVEMTVDSWRSFKDRMQQVVDADPKSALGVVLTAFLDGQKVQPYDFSAVLEKMIKALDSWEKAQTELHP